MTRRFLYRLPAPFRWALGLTRGGRIANLVIYLALGLVLVALGLPLLAVWGGVFVTRAIGSRLYD